MTEPTRVTAGSTIQIADLNQLIDLIEGGNSMTAAYNLVSTSGEDFIIKLADDAGARKILIKDSNGTTVASIGSTGVATFSSVTSSGDLILPGSTSPGETTEGSAQWDTNDDVLVVGNGSAAKRVSPYVAAGAAPVVKGEIAHNTTTGITSIHDGTSAVALGPLTKIKTAQQRFSANTTYADISASSGNFAFTIAANEIWQIEAFIRATMAGTGGIKMQLTGPAAPTLVVAQLFPTYGDGTTGENTVWAGSVVTSFSSNLIAANYNAGAAGTPTNGVWRLHAYIANGANAGTVTLQGAQNSANSTTDFEPGSIWKAWKLG